VALTPACDPGYSSVALLDAMGFHSKYRPEIFRALDFGKELSDAELSKMCVWCKTMFVEMSQAARTAFEQVPFSEAGTLYPQKGTLKAFLPTPEEFERGDFIRDTAATIALCFSPPRPT